MTKTASTLRSVRRTLRYSTPVNVLKIHTNSYEHEKLKFDIAYFLRVAGHDIATEAIFKDYPGRCDVLDLSQGVAYEIVASESKASILRKKKNYPPEVLLIPVKVGELPFDELPKFLGVE